MVRKCKTEYRPEYDRDYSSIRVGMDVCGLEGDKVGEISKIYMKPSEETAQIMVEKGESVDKDVYIPLDAVRAVDRDNVFLECPSGQCGKMGWDKPEAGGEEVGTVYVNLAEQSPDVYPNIVGQPPESKDMPKS